MAKRKKPGQGPTAVKDSRIEFKRDKDGRRRDRSWRKAEANDWYENEWSDRERVMPRGERERRLNAGGGNDCGRDRHRNPRRA